MLKKDKAVILKYPLKQLKKISAKAAITFVLALMACSVIIAARIVNKTHIEKLTMERLIAEKSITITEVISELLYRTQAIAAVIMHNYGEIEGFDRIAATITNDPAVYNVLAAPAGVVTHIYPLEGNEVTIGLDFFGGGPGQKEAVLSKETGQLILGGPYDRLQGGRALVGRLPVFLNMPGGERQFWGLVSIALRYPHALESVGLASLTEQGFTYEIWSVNPDTDKKQIISENGGIRPAYRRFVEMHIPVLNADWYFRIGITREWYEYIGNWAMIVAGVAVSAVIAYIVQNNYILKETRGELENIAHIDALTGIANRRYFMATAPLQIAKAKRTREDCHIVMFDIDFFKKVNDTYGHAAGDIVLKEIAERTKASMRPYDLFARFGGEEFIILLTGPEKPHVKNIVENYRRVVADTPFVYDSIRLNITASFGVAQMAADNLETVIRHADKALYDAKAGGRNRVCFAVMPDVSQPMQLCLDTAEGKRA